MKPSNTAILALAIASITASAHAESVSQAFIPTQLDSSNAQDEAKGFVDGQSLSGQTRNWYSNELLRRGATFT